MNLLQEIKVNADYNFREAFTLASKKLKKNILLYAFIMSLLLVTNCKEEIISNNTLAEPEICEYLTLKFNETINVPNTNGTLKISFNDVEDDRCSIQSCYLCYGSFAKVQISIINDNNEIKIELWMIGCVEEYDYEYFIGVEEDCLDNRQYIDTLGYRFTITKLSPYPGLKYGSTFLNPTYTDEPISKEDYITKIWVRKL
jgi:hypothetical protein